MRRTGKHQNTVDPTKMALPMTDFTPLINSKKSIAQELKDYQLKLALERENGFSRSNYKGATGSG